MTNQERKLFDELHNSRLKDIQTFRKRQYQGIWNGIIDKYPESAHFIYELLQNADDAEATQVKIEILPDALIFRHNGTVRFTITEEIDDPSVVLGHINSITSIGDSTKKAVEGNKIGKFGVGFKSVFQYTDVPEIYDDTFCFKISNYIVPTLLDHDYKNRKVGETVFRFPYKNPSKTIDEILNRLRNLSYPILFLTNLKEVIWENKVSMKPTSHFYRKNTLYELSKGDILFEILSLSTDNVDETLFHFTRKVNIKGVGTHAIKVGYFYDKENQSLRIENGQNIFCFFPTKETFGTCYISHAPFKLVDSRQNIKEDESVNEFLIDEITKLAADALPIIRDYGKNVLGKTLFNEDIWNIIPIQMAEYRYFNRSLTCSRHILDIFIDRIIGEDLFLTNAQTYTSLNNAAIATPITILDYFNNKQIIALLHKNVQLLSKDICKYLSSEKKVSDFACDDLGLMKVTSADIAKAITSEFMKCQEKKWILRFYLFLMNEASSLWKPKGKSTDNLPFRHAPIVLTSLNEWVSPYDGDALNVFLPFSSYSEGLNFVNHEYLKEENAKRFFSELGIKEPNKRDFIVSSILQMYDGSRIVTKYADDHFITIYNYYRSLGAEKEREEFKDLVKKHYKLYTRDNTFDTPCSVYSDETGLADYYGAKNSSLLKSEMYPKSKQTLNNDFYEFLGELGMKRLIQCEETKYRSMYALSDLQLEEIGQIPNHTECECRDYTLDGFEEANRFHRITKSASALIWDSIADLDLDAVSNGSFRWKYYSWTGRKFTSKFATQIRTTKWMYGKDGKLYIPSQISLENFDEDLYAKVDELIKYFGISKSEKSIMELGGTQEQQELYELGKMLRENNIDKNGLKHLLEIGKREKQKIKEDQLAQAAKDLRKANSVVSRDSSRDSQHGSKTNNDTEEDNSDQVSLSESLKSDWEERKQKKVGIPRSNQAKPHTYDVLSTNSTAPKPNKILNFGDVISKPKPKSNTGKENKSVSDAQKQLEKVLRQSELLELLNNTQKYSYLWFKYLGEALFGDKSRTSKREIEIQFSSSELICDDRVFVVSNANVVVPKWIEFPDSLEIILVWEKQNMRLNASIMFIEDTSVHLQINDTSAKILKWCRNCKCVILKAVSTQSIFDSLMTRFVQLGLEDTFDMNSNLPSNIEFIYGPPGTGKTTTVVKRVEDILSSSNDGIKILILTPTNKAADVIARKMVDFPNCYDALSRFGATEDQLLIEEGLLRDRESLIMEDLPKNVVVTTAARYAYDGFATADYTSICDIDWDYVIIDEASMIDLLTITYILYKSKPNQFIISGDPKQIQPTGNGDLQPENIYQMIGLYGFRNAITSFNRFKVTPLMTQYRSVESIGNLVSNFSYDGLISSNNSHERKKLTLDGMQIRDINFVAFPVQDFDNLFGQTAVSGSAIHIYSAIFTYNFARYIAKQAQNNAPQTEYTLGIVSPYRKQADIVQQLIDGHNINSENCTVKCGTVHSFQGDECDIMIMLLNSPTSLSANCHALNENIINVGISRAKDYLFIITPDSNNPKFYTRNNLGLLSQKDRADFHCLNLEQIIFGHKNFIRNNTDIRCHLPVNVYSDSWAEYDVRLSDEAIDIQINSNQG
jgi:hypothetical protein